MNADEREQMTRALTRNLRRILEVTPRRARSAAEDLIDAGWTLPAEWPGEPAAELAAAVELRVVAIGAPLDRGGWECACTAPDMGFWVRDLSDIRSAVIGLRPDLPPFTLKVEVIP